MYFYVNRGYSKAQLKQYHAAIKDYDKAIKSNPKDAEAYFLRGNAKVGLKQYRAAIKDYDKVIELYPKFAHAYLWRGDAKTGLNQHDAATRDYQTALRLARQANNKVLEAKIFFRGIDIRKAIMSFIALIIFVFAKRQWIRNIALLLIAIGVVASFLTENPLVSLLANVVGLAILLPFLYLIRGFIRRRAKKDL